MYWSPWWHKTVYRSYSQSSLYCPTRDVHSARKSYKYRFVCKRMPPQFANFRNIACCVRLRARVRSWEFLCTQIWLVCSYSLCSSCSRIHFSVHTFTQHACMRQCSNIYYIDYIVRSMHGSNGAELAVQHDIVYSDWCSTSACVSALLKKGIVVIWIICTADAIRLFVV